MSFAERIDTHAHFVPSIWRTACEQASHGKPDGMPAVPQWSEETHLELMHKLSITKSILSITSPGTHITPGDDASGRKLTRDCNEYAADLVSRHPAQFGFWATLPLPDIAGSLEEIAHALDELHADGIALETNHHGKYLGDAVFDPVFAELERRKATVFIHPTGPCIAHTTGPQAAVPLPQYPSPMFEFFFDTARAVVNLFLSGTIARCPHVTFILSHGAGALAPIVERFASFTTSILERESKIDADMVKQTLQRQFYLDLAGFVFPDQIHSILRCVGPDRLLYGSDYPYTPAKGVETLVEKMERGLEEVFPEEETRRAILVGNAQKLLASRKS